MERSALIGSHQKDAQERNEAAGRLQDGCIALSEVVSALSFALDLTEDAVPGHAVRSCLLGMRLGMAIGLPAAQLSDLYYALLLKDIGCSSNSARMCQILGGDDRKAKREVKTVDWTRPTIAGVKMAWANALPGASSWRKAMRLAQLSVDQKSNNAEMIALRCDRGASIVRKIGLTEECAAAIYSLDEHWNGSGYPHRLQGKSAPLLARILGVAQHLDVFAGEQSRERAVQTLRERSGSWFDPEMVRISVALDRDGTLWTGCGTPEERSRAMDLEPGSARTIDAGQTDRICEAFADVVDAKSSFTYRHSLGVTEAACGIALQLGLNAERRKLIYRSALLHDLGKLRVPNTILDKPDKLDDAEWLIVREHPLLSQQVLERVPSFAAMATIAGRHHEKLDGTGYPHGLRDNQLCLEDRIVAVADIYGALSENRPYRAGLAAEQIIAILRKEVPKKLDPDCFEALLAFMQTEPSSIHARL
ncbi:MAG: HD domain-containing phosphohydrolase [Silvibacterium sp.]